MRFSEGEIKHWTIIALPKQSEYGKGNYYDVCVSPVIFAFYEPSAHRISSKNWAICRKIHFHHKLSLLTPPLSAISFVLLTTLKNPTLCLTSSYFISNYQTFMFFRGSLSLPAGHDFITQLYFYSFKLISIDFFVKII